MSVDSKSITQEINRFFSTRSSGILFLDNVSKFGIRKVGTVYLVEVYSSNYDGKIKKLNLFELYITDPYSQLNKIYKKVKYDPTAKTIKFDRLSELVEFISSQRCVEFYNNYVDYTINERMKLIGNFSTFTIKKFKYED